MALIKCKECDGQISDRAPFCPHCGAAVPGLNSEQIHEIVKRNAFLKQRWVAGFLFWPGVILILWPVFLGGDKDVFLQNWQISKWLIGIGFLWYVTSEIDRNLYERKIKKQQMKLENTGNNQ